MTPTLQIDAPALQAGAGARTSNARTRPPSVGSRACVVGPRVSVVIPTLDEAENLASVFARLPDDLWELIIVDGRSTDDTIAVAKLLRPDARIVLERRRGKGAALQAGFAAATGEIIVMLDADGSTDPSEIQRFVDALIAGADFAKGTRFGEGGSSEDITRIRRIGNRALLGTVNLLYGTRYTDLCYGYNAFWRSCWPVLDATCDGFDIETLINVRIARADLKVVEIASVEHQRLHGESKLHAFRDGSRVLRTILLERMRRAPRRYGRLWVPTLDVDAAAAVLVV